MKNRTPTVLALTLALASLCFNLSSAEEHFATRLGAPATRFAPPLQTPEDLRARFRDAKLRPDFASVLRQWGWKGDVEDLHRAALSNEITEVQIPVGAVMPFMSSREGGKAICLRNVHWKGKEPIQAYAFNFTSKGRRYRCVTPKPCSNFFVEDPGTPALSLSCEAPAKVLTGRPAKVCLTLRNTGDATEPAPVLTLAIPDGASYLSPSDGVVAGPGLLRWTLPPLAPGETHQLCESFSMSAPGTLGFESGVQGEFSPAAKSSCSTPVEGVAGVLVEVVDLEDPIEVGKEVIYEIELTNQGNATLTNLRLVCFLPESQEYVSGAGSTAVTARDGRITLDPVASLTGKAVASWRVVVKATKADDARFKLELRGDQFEKVIERHESTTQY